MVKQVTIDEYIQTNRIDQVRFVKLDIEGAEMEAIMGMRDLLMSERGPDLLCEVNPYLLTQRDLSSRSITNALDRYGYLFFRVQKGGISPVSKDANMHQLTNLYCTKKLPVWKSFE